MENLDRIRFLAANYPNLQGLKQVPFGIMAVLVSLWGNSLRRPATDITFPILVTVACIGLYVLIGRYYAHVFGQIHRTSASSRLDWFIQTAGAILALVAFGADTALKPPVSTLGLVFSGVILADYMRMTHGARDRFLLYYPALAIVMIVLSLLPLLGLVDWWQAIGIRSPIVGVVMVFGLLVTVVGILVHLFLVRNLPRVSEVANG